MQPLESCTPSKFMYKLSIEWALFGHLVEELSHVSICDHTVMLHFYPCDNNVNSNSDLKVKLNYKNTQMCFYRNNKKHMKLVIRSDSEPVSPRPLQPSIKWFQIFHINVAILPFMSLMSTTRLQGPHWHIAPSTDNESFIKLIFTLPLLMSLNTSFAVGLIWLSFNQWFWKCGPGTLGVTWRGYKWLALKHNSIRVIFQS